MHPALALGIFVGAAPLPHDPSNAFEKHAVSVIQGKWGPQPQWKIDLLFSALAKDAKPQPCRISFYHPREAGRGWRRWTGTRTGTMVRPGVASCTARNWRRWGGAWLWVEDYGVCHVEDCFPESRDPNWFDLASPATPETPSYSTWLNSYERARFARRFGKQGRRFVVLKVPGEES